MYHAGFSLDGEALPNCARCGENPIHWWFIKPPKEAKDQEWCYDCIKNYETKGEYGRIKSIKKAVEKLSIEGTVHIRFDHDEITAYLWGVGTNIYEKASKNPDEWLEQAKDMKRRLLKSKKALAR